MQEQQSFTTRTRSIGIGTGVIAMFIGSLWVPGSGAFPFWGNALGTAAFALLGTGWIVLNHRRPHLFDWMRDAERVEAVERLVMKCATPLLIVILDAFFWALSQPGPHSLHLPLTARIAVLGVFSLVFLSWWVLLLTFPVLEDKGLPGWVFITFICAIPAGDAWLFCSPQIASICTVLAAGVAVCLSLLYPRWSQQHEDDELLLENGCARHASDDGAGRSCYHGRRAGVGQTGGSVFRGRMAALVQCDTTKRSRQRAMWVFAPPEQEDGTYFTQLVWPSLLLAWVGAALVDAIALLSEVVSLLLALVCEQLVEGITGGCVEFGLLCGGLTAAVLDLPDPVGDFAPWVVDAFSAGEEFPRTPLREWVSLGVSALAWGILLGWYGLAWDPALCLALTLLILQGFDPPLW